MADATEGAAGAGEPPRRARRPRWRRRIVILGIAAVVLVAAAVAAGSAAHDRARATLSSEPSTPQTATVASTTVASTVASTAAPSTTSAATVTTGPPEPGGDYVAVTPARLVDTRTGTGISGGRAGKAPSVTASIGDRAKTAGGHVKAVALNVTIAEPTQAGYLTVSAAGSQPSEVSQIAFVSATASSLIVTKTSSDGRVELRLSDGASSHIIVDLLGYFVSTRSPDNLSIIPEPQPVGLVDSRAGAPIGPGTTVDVTLPAPQAGAVLGITATGAAGPGYLTVYGGAARPDTSAVNFGPGHDATAMSIVATSADRTVHLYNGSAAPVHVVVFQIARLVSGTPAGALELNIEGTIAQDGRSAPFPFRTVDTRGSSTCPTTLGGGVASISNIFPKAKALLVSITVVDASAPSYLIAYTGAAQPPSVATLNYDAHDARSNLALIPVSGDRVNIVCGGGNPEYILDVLATLE